MTRHAPDTTLSGRYAIVFPDVFGIVPGVHQPVPDLRLPAPPPTFHKGSTLTVLLDRDAVDCLAHNLRVADRRFDAAEFRADALTGFDPLSIMRRGDHLAAALHRWLPSPFDRSVAVLLRSLTPPLMKTKDFISSGFFYLPHTCFIARFGLDAAYNGGRDPFETALAAQYELTRRFTAEFSIRPFLIHWPERTLARLRQWTADPDPHVRRWCSEGTRPRLPWGLRLPAFVRDPSPTLPILEALKDDPELYVRRSVANHLGDIAKDHPDLVFDLCARWLRGASAERKWLIRHAVRHPAKKGVKAALKLRRLAA